MPAEIADGAGWISPSAHTTSACRDHPRNADSQRAHAKGADRDLRRAGNAAVSGGAGALEAPPAQAAKGAKAPQGPHGRRRDKARNARRTVTSASSRAGRERVRLCRRHRRRRRTARRPATRRKRRQGLVLHGRASRMGVSWFGHCGWADGPPGAVVPSHRTNVGRMQRATNAPNA